MKSTLKSLVVTSVSMVVFATAAHATLIWNGSATGGLAVFKNINIQDSSDNFVSNPSPNGSVAQVVNDATYGSIFQFYKDNNDRRCEAHGAAGFDPAIGSTYYIGWGFKITSTVDDNAVFQWKSYGSPMVQNYPFVIKMVGGNLQVHYYPPNSGDLTIWSHSISANTWYKAYVKVTVSDQTSGGKLQFWFNDTQQTFSNGSTTYTGKTFDGSSVDPKWGIYGAVGTSMSDYIRHARIGTALTDVQF